MPSHHLHFQLSLDEAARNLEGAPGAFLMRDEGRHFLGAFSDGASTQKDPMPELDVDVAEQFGDFPRWIGVLPYEAFREGERRSGPTEDPRSLPLVSSPLWRRYPAVACFSGENVEIRGTDPTAVERLAGQLRTPPEQSRVRRDRATLRWAEPPEAGEVHLQRVEAALRAIERGDLYQVNLARRFRFRVQGSALSILRALGPMARAPFAAALDFGGLSVVSASPELFLDVSPSGAVLTRPIKGTRPRDLDRQRDALLAHELDASEKERAELAMVIDLERNDLGRISEIGTVRLRTPPHVRSYPTVHHREAEVESQLLPALSREQLLDAMMPSGSVTGAPKISAMDLIAEHESERRGLYTGALGFISGEGGMRLSMAIRVLVIDGEEAHYFAGGGIVADSDPQQELEETVWKAEQLQALIDVSRPPVPADTD